MSQLGVPLDFAGVDTLEGTIQDWRHTTQRRYRSVSVTLEINGVTGADVSARV